MRDWVNWLFKSGKRDQAAEKHDHSLIQASDVIDIDDLRSMRENIRKKHHEKANKKGDP